MDALELLIGRESALKLASPGPDQDALEKMFQSALHAPDHGRLRPWKFVVVPEGKRERFGELMADCLRRMEPTASADALQRERDKAMRAPVIVVVAATIHRGHKIPEVEQVVSAAAADHNYLSYVPFRIRVVPYDTIEAAKTPVWAIVTPAELQLLQTSGRAGEVRHFTAEPDRHLVAVHRR